MDTTLVTAEAGRSGVVGCTKDGAVTVLVGPAVVGRMVLVEMGSSVPVK